MKILFVHQNFPAQYLHLARHLVATGHEVVAITQRRDYVLPGVRTLVYEPHRRVTPGQHHYLRETEAGVLNAQAVLRVALDLKAAGFVPDVMFGHNGWGEIWYLKEAFPAVPLVGYFEFFYRLHGADVGFDPAEAITPDSGPRIRTKNLGNLLALDAVDLGQCPTAWQKSLYPAAYQPKLHRVHEGIDTQTAAPNPQARLALPHAGVELHAGDEVVTYVARNLEPYRGFPSFMRSLSAVLNARPCARVVIVGGDETSYGHALPPGQTHRQRMIDEVGDSVDWTRVHFLGKVPYNTFLSVLQVSRVHVYLTYPFVLSWSMLEAMAAGCVVVASRTAPVQEVVQDRSNGLLVDLFSPSEISARVLDVLREPSAFASLSSRARQTVVDGYDLMSICLPAQLRLLDLVRGLGHSPA